MPLQPAFAIPENQILAVTAEFAVNQQVVHIWAFAQQALETKAIHRKFATGNGTTIKAMCAAAARTIPVDPMELEATVSLDRPDIASATISIIFQ